MKETELNIKKINSVKELHSFMGLPSPNIFTGMQAIHSKKEWIGVKDMHKAVEVLVNLVQVWEEKA